MPQADLETLYGKHPLSEDAILARVREYSSNLRNISELDLAFDPVTEITDQNHVGGLQSLINLATGVGIGPDHHVLYLGAGLGGPCRALACLYGCHVRGVEITRIRYKSAVRLTHLTALTDLVQFTKGDALSVKVPIPEAGYDFVLGQSSFMQIGHHEELMKRCASFLRPGKTLVIEDCVLHGNKNDLVRARQALWAGELHPVNIWQQHLESAGFVLVAVENLSPAAERYYSRWIELNEVRPDKFDQVEVASWLLAKNLLGADKLRYVRLVARRV